MTATLINALLIALLIIAAAIAGIGFALYSLWFFGYFKKDEPLKYKAGNPGKNHLDN